jgi:hypothetical protein
MVWLKRKEPASYKQIVPCPGDFHTAVHMLMAIHILWWNSFISNITQRTELSELSLMQIGAASNCTTDTVNSMNQLLLEF